MKHAFFNILTSLLILTSACTQNPKSVDVSSVEGVKYHNREAVGFQILALQDSLATLMRLAKAPQNRPYLTDSILILSDGLGDPKGFSGVVIRGEARRIITLAPEIIPMLDSLGVAERIVGVAEIEAITNNIVNNRYRQGRLLSLRQKQGIDLDAVVALHPDIIILDAQANGDNDLKQRLTELKIPYIYINKEIERSTLAKTEWIVALAQIVGRDQIAREYYDTIKKEYDDLLRRTIEILKLEEPSLQVDSIARI